MKLVIGTRGSDLALTQTKTVAGLLRALPGVREVEIRIIRTLGDRIQNTPLSDLTGTPDERKGFFTKELEDALLAGTIDLAVHSYKDLPTAEIPGLSIGAIPQRVSSRDILIIRAGAKVREQVPFVAPGAAIGTASVRRMALVERVWPDVRTVPLRGNLPTRLIRLKEGAAPNLADQKAPAVPIHAILLAEAGVERLRAAGVFDRGEHAGLLDGLLCVPLEPDLFPPAPAQGALAIQCRSDDVATRQVLAALHDAKVETAVRLERRVLAALEGGCHLPLGIACRTQAPLGPQDRSELRVDLFLGGQAADNRFGRSVRMVRFGPASQESAQALAERLVFEIKEQVPVVFTGRAERAADLARSFPIVALPLIETETIRPDPAHLAQLRAWCQDAQISGENPTVALFSVPGATAFAQLVKEEGIHVPSGARFAVSGERTADCAQALFPDAEIAARSPDGTGAALADLLLEARTTSVLSLCAQHGRPEFRDRLLSAGAKVLTLELYRTKTITPDQTSLAALPARCYLVFGSPSGVDAFLDGLIAAPDVDSRGFACCAIGPTTAGRLRQRGIVPYAVAAQADYESLLSELVCTPPNLPTSGTATPVPFG